MERIHFINEGETIDNMKGFSLIEILIAVSIIAILTSIAIVSFLTPRIDANEIDVIALLKKIYLYQNGLDWDARLDKVTPEGTSHGYHFLLEEDPASKIKWKAYAWPIEYKVTGLRSFYIDKKGYPCGKDIGGVIPRGMTLPFAE